MAMSRVGLRAGMKTAALAGALALMAAVPLAWRDGVLDAGRGDDASAHDHRHR